MLVTHCTARVDTCGRFATTSGPITRTAAANLLQDWRRLARCDPYSYRISRRRHMGSSYGERWVTYTHCVPVTGSVATLIVPRRGGLRP
jgi:hypothetical protein